MLASRAEAGRLAEGTSAEIPFTHSVIYPATFCISAGAIPEADGFCYIVTDGLHKLLTYGWSWTAGSGVATWALLNWLGRRRASSSQVTPPPPRSDRSSLPAQQRSWWDGGRSGQVPLVVAALNSRAESPGDPWGQAPGSERGVDQENHAARQPVLTNAHQTLTCAYIRRSWSAIFPHIIRDEEVVLPRPAIG